jgi:hypothetical protein
MWVLEDRGRGSGLVGLISVCRVVNTVCQMYLEAF